MMHIALLALALALAGGAPWLLDGMSGGWAGHGLEAGGHADPNGTTAKVGNQLDPNGAPTASDAGTIADPNGESVDGDLGTILDPNG